MRRFIPWLVLAVIVAGVSALSLNTGEASAGLPTHDSRFDLQCQQTIDPNSNDQHVGEVQCSLTIDIPERLSPPLPDEIKLDIVALYKDRDGNNRPSPGDRLLCIRVTGAGIDFQRCRPGIEPPDLSPPA